MPFHEHSLSARPSTGQLFRIWAGIGFQSFGGGSSAQFLIQRTFIEEHEWLTPEEYLHLWSLCLITPGINLVALTILIGLKCGGVRGVVVSLAGLLVPSAFITCLLAAGYKRIEGFAAVQAILRGVVPATAGVALLVGLNFARPLITRGYKEGSRALVASGVLIVAVAVGVVLLKVTVAFVVIGAVLFGALAFTPRTATPQPDERGGAA